MSYMTNFEEEFKKKMADFKKTQMNKQKDFHTIQKKKWLVSIYIELSNMKSKTMIPGEMISRGKTMILK